MRGRTSTLDIVRLAWRLWRNRDRRYLRIGQMILNQVPDPQLYYVENDELVGRLHSPTSDAP